MIRFNEMPDLFRRSAAASRIALGVGVVLFLVGGLFVVLAVSDYREGEATKAWPSTTAQIRSAHVDEDVRRDRDSDGSTRTHRTYMPAVSYEYVVDGTTYQGHRIRADDAIGSQERAHRIINRYPVGTETTAYYNPDDPGSAVLEQGAELAQVYLFGGIGGVFALIGLGALGMTGLNARRA